MVSESPTHRPHQYGALSWAGWILVSASALSLTLAPVVGQGPTGGSNSYNAPRTAWGDPDFQGIWTTDQFGQHVDLERPPELAGKFETTEEETEARKNNEAERNAFGDTVGNYGREWRDTEFSKFKPSRRTSLISDPEDGRVPYSAEVIKRRAASANAPRRPAPLPRGPEDLGDGLRCLRGFPGVNLPIGYNNNKQIVQGPGYVAITYEMNHDTRVIPVGGQTSLGSGITQDWGDPRGRWEGDTLVIETSNFSGRRAFQGSRDQLKVTERFRRISVDELDYKFTVEDPTVFSRAWTVWMPWLRDDSQYEVLEYACHEGNYGIANTLSGARARERRGAGTE
jgi:hypothetical protein